MRFLVDAQLPLALCRFLRGVGHECSHVSDFDLLQADDAPIWDHAVRQHAVILTKDEDFANRKLLRAGGPAVVWIRVGNCSNRALLQWFQPLLGDIVARLEGGEDLIEVD